MTLHFTFSEADALAFLERYLRESRTHQRTLTQMRWGFPILFLAMAGYDVWSYRFWPSTALPLLIIAIAWWLFYPSYAHARIRSRLKRSLRESTSPKNFGAHQLALLEEELRSTSPTGSSIHHWSGVQRVVLDPTHLHVILAGSQGWAIPLADIGPETAQRAHAFISARLAPQA